MSKPLSRHNIQLLLLASVVFSNIASADEQTYVREYIYQASEADSKISARAIALQEVKRILLSELGTHVSSLVKQQSSSDGTHLGTEEIETLSAGVTSVEILDEKWNGVVYVLKAQIRADPEDVLKSLHKMLDSDKKQKQISQLGGDLSQIRTENIQIAESLTQSKKEATAALAEIARLKQQLEKQQTEASRKTLQTDYQKQVDQLTLNELFESAVKYSQEGKHVAAFTIFKKIAEQGYAESQFNLGVMYGNGDGVARDAHQAAYWYQKAAEQGVAYAQFNLGRMYEKGDGVARDAQQAAYWYQKAAEQGHAKAQSNLGVMYGDGVGVALDAQQAVFWYRKAAEQGLAESQFNLGLMYAKGEGISRDPKQAVFWFRKAAEQGVAYAQFILGGMYGDGVGVTRDAQQAVFWYRKAAEQGVAGAQYNLGGMYGNGDGLARDAKQELFWYRKAAEQGHASAQFNLGVMYTKGEGISDPKEAVYWFQKAAEQGHARAQNVLNTINGKQ